MWPFGRRPKEREAGAPGRGELLPSQLDNALRYGWQGMTAEDVKEAFQLMERPRDEAGPVERPAT